MKRLFYMILLFTPLFSQGQDPSFSQFDLNMMYSNPAFAGYEGSTKPLLHSRNQWNGINENFNNSIFEISTNIKLNRNDRKSSTSWSPGIGVIKEDLVGINGTGNNVFINRMEFSLYPFTFHKRIDFKIGNLKIDNLWLSWGGGIHARQYSLDDSRLIFSDQWSALGQFSGYGSSGAPLSEFIHDDWQIDGSTGFILTQQGRYQSTQGNRFMAGWSLSHIARPKESLSGSSARVPLKNIIHAEWFYGVPSFRTPFIPYIKTMFKHERYGDDFYKTTLPWKESLISKTEFGGTAFVNNTPIEIGSIYRICHNYDNSYHSQSFVPLIRYRFSRNHLWILSYSYDMNIAAEIDRLNIGDTKTTHEMGVSIYLYAGQGRSGCPAFMENSEFYKDIYENGLLNFKKNRRNFKLHKKQKQKPKFNYN